MQYKSLQTNIGGTDMRPVILASASPRRKEILSKLNIPFMVEVSNVNEEDISMKPEGFAYV